MVDSGLKHSGSSDKGEKANREKPLQGIVNAKQILTGSPSKAWLAAAARGTGRQCARKKTRAGKGGTGAANEAAK